VMKGGQIYKNELKLELKSGDSRALEELQNRSH
jgi:hypothetical protein